ncbi:DUF475 domain-containing protein [Candidatus Roizmanbacteria bacterium]|nr:DUF475 domain-containing protein [Candidatus Roizmanbacteria bacterium]
MDIPAILLTVFGLSLFEIVSSIDNAIINAEVLSTMKPPARKWFLFWGVVTAVFVVRGLLPWMIVWATSPALGPIGSLTATFSSDPKVARAVETSSPLLLIGGGVFLIFLFFHWLFMENKSYGLPVERFIRKQSVWFYAVVSILLAMIVWSALKVHPFLAFSAVMGSTGFFIVYGFRQTAEREEERLLQKNGQSDISKILYLEVIDATFSIDGVVGAFAFTLSVPLILLGNGLGAIILRQLTVGNVERIKKYRYLKNGAMYSILALGVIMILDSFGHHIPQWVSPLTTLLLIAYFGLKSRNGGGAGEI